MSKILAIDTSTDACSVALLCDNEVIDRFIIKPQQHTKFILPLIDEVLAEAGIALGQLDAISFCNGPGSFTGIRLAASIVQGLSFPFNLPVVMVSTLRALAFEAFVEFGARRILVTQDARMNEVYWGEYQVDSNNIMQAVRPDGLIDPNNLKVVPNEELFGIGSGFDVYKDILSIEVSKILPIKHVQAKYLIKLAEDDFKKDIFVSSDNALPIYIREKITS